MEPNSFVNMEMDTMSRLRSLDLLTALSVPNFSFIYIKIYVNCCGFLFYNKFLPINLFKLEEFYQIMFLCQDL